MSKLFRYGGIAASIILIAFGIGALYMGVNGRDQVRSDLAREQIVGTPDSTIPGQKVDTGSEAKAFAASCASTRSRPPAARPTRRWAATSTRTASRPATRRPPPMTPRPASPSRTAAATSGSPRPRLQTALNTAYFAESVATFAIVMGIALLLVGIGFLVLTIRLLDRPEHGRRPRRAPTHRRARRRLTRTPTHLLSHCGRPLDRAGRSAFARSDGTARDHPPRPAPPTECSGARVSRRGKVRSVARTARGSPAANGCRGTARARARGRPPPSRPRAPGLRATRAPPHRTRRGRRDRRAGAR